MKTSLLLLLLSAPILQASVDLASTQVPNAPRPTRWGPSVTVKKRPLTGPLDLQEGAKRRKTVVCPDIPPPEAPKKLLDADGDATMSDAQPTPAIHQPAAIPAIPIHPETEVKQKSTDAAACAAAAAPVSEQAHNMPMTDVEQKETSAGFCSLE